MVYIPGVRFCLPATRTSGTPLAGVQFIGRCILRGNEPSLSSDSNSGNSVVGFLSTIIVTTSLDSAGQPLDRRVSVLVSVLLSQVCDSPWGLGLLSDYPVLFSHGCCQGNDLPLTSCRGFIFSLPIDHRVTNSPPSSAGILGKSARAFGSSEFWNM